MRTFLICLFIIGMNATIPNCAYQTNNQCVSCSYGYQLVNFQCANCSTGFILVNNRCVNSTTYAQNTATTSSTASTSGNFQAYGNNANTSTQTPSSNILSGTSSSSSTSSSSQTVVVQNINSNPNQSAPISTSTNSQYSSGSANSATSGSSGVTVQSSSSSSSYVFDISNTGVMYFLQLFGLASQIPVNCQSFTSNFICVSCVSGYSLASSANFCIQNINNNSSSTATSTTTTTTTSTSTTTASSSDPNCQISSNTGCQLCYYSYYYNATLQKCTTVNPQCQTWTNQNLCLTCYNGYSLTASGNCVITGSSSSNSNSANSTTTVTSATDPFCQTPITGSSICQQCYYGYYYNSTIQRCTGVNILCQTWTSQNLCTSCYAGYSLNTVGACILNRSGLNSSTTSTNGTSSTNSGTVLISSDLNCQIPTTGSSVCQQCYYSFYYNSTTQKCQTVNPLCKTWTNQNLCLSCYEGYTLTAVGTCIISNTQTVNYVSSDLPAVMDPFCNLYSNKICVRCAPRTYLASNGSCIQIDPNCQSWNNATGACSQCYVGYVVTNVNFCSIINPSVLTVQQKSSLNTDVNCLKSNSTGICTQCIFRYVLNSNNACIKVNDLCQQWNNTTALCTACYGGYTLTNGACNISY